MGAAAATRLHQRRAAVRWPHPAVRRRPGRRDLLRRQAQRRRPDDQRRHASRDTSLVPLLFVTIACGAISGFHGMVSSGTSSKQLDKETDARFVGYFGAVGEGLLSLGTILAVVAGFRTVAEWEERLLRVRCWRRAGVRRRRRNAHARRDRAASVAHCHRARHHGGALRRNHAWTPACVSSGSSCRRSARRVEDQDREVPATLSRRHRRSRPHLLAGPRRLGRPANLAALWYDEPAHGIAHPVDPRGHAHPQAAHRRGRR